MNQLELKEAIEGVLPGWHVTVDEAEMINVVADEETKPFCYIEEYDQVTDNATKFGNRRTRREEVYFVMITNMHNNGEQRVAIRENTLRPACDKVEKMLREQWGVTVFSTDPMPRGFDANEVLLHLVFEYTEALC